MSLDRRVRDAFDRAAATVEPNVELHLDATLRRAAEPSRASVLGTVLAASAATVALVIAIRLLGIPNAGIGDPSSDPTASPTASGPNAAVAGTYSVALLDADAGVEASDLGLAGTWSITLEPSGAIEVEPPTTFVGSRAGGHTFSLDGSTLRTDLYYNDYCSSIGVYRWETRGGGLALTVAEDDCEIRRTILATRDLEAGNR